MPDDVVEQHTRIGWWRATLSSVAILAVGIGVLVYGTNAVVTRLLSVSRSTRVGIATTVFVLAFGALAWTFRRLQRGHII
jgi:hypothetical protein